VQTYSFERTTQTSLAFGGLFAVVGCSHDGTKQPEAILHGSTLYERLGKFEGLQKIVGGFMADAGADLRINRLLPPSELERLEWLLIDKLSDLSGGPRSRFYGIRSAQAGLLITWTDFNALIEHFDRALDRSGVGETEKVELLGMLTPMSERVSSI
jgi:truncated hemoglobin YjbI